ncbi:MAG: TatD family hydrolase [Kiritimatiellia bacterium]
MMSFVDMHSHAHRLSQPGRCWPAQLVCCGTQPADWEVVAAWSRQHVGALPGYGIHPWFVDACGEDALSVLEQRLRADTSAGVGEIGLHFTKAHPNRVQQRWYFTAQLQLGVSLGRWISIHCVHAWGALLRSLDEAGCADARVMVHDFYGRVEVARALMDRGVYLSLRWREDRPRLAELVSKLDARFLLVESDAGGCAVDTAYDGGILSDTIRRIALCRGEEPEALAEVVYANSLRVLGLEF